MRRPFAYLHPCVPVIYFAGTFLLSVFVIHPVYLALSLVGSLLLGALCEGPRDTARHLRWQLPFMAAVCLANPLFSHAGVTTLATVGPVTIRLEALAYGGCMAMMLVAMAQWLQCASVALSGDRALDLGSRRLPALSVMLSIASQLVPQLLHRSRDVTAALDACSAAGRPSRARVSTILMSWAMEDSLERADAMRARGWDSGRPRTRYRTERSSVRDVAWASALVLLTLLNMLLALRALGQWTFYPTMPHLRAWWGYLPFALQVLLPSASVLLDDARWRLLK